jgi:hypothetical protein
LRNRRRAFDRVDLLDQLREHGALIARSGTDLEHATRHARFQQGLGHARHDPGLRNRLALADRQRGVFVGARGECFVDEQMPRQLAHHIEHTAVANALGGQAIDQTIARTLRGHAEPARGRIAAREQTHAGRLMTAALVAAALMKAALMRRRRGRAAALRPSR